MKIQLQKVAPFYWTVLALIMVNLGWGQVTMTTSGGYTQNFVDLANSGTGNTWINNSTISNWYSQRSGTGTTYAADAGTSNGGNLYSYGTGTNSERAMGSLGSGNSAVGNFAHGVLLKNTSGIAITDIKISYTLEQWRNGGNTTANTITFWYKISSSTITALNPNSNGTWTQVAELSLSSLKNTSSATALDGNASANKVSASNISIPGLSLENNDFIMLKWEDPDHTGTDHGLAIDDVTISWIVSTTWNGTTWSNGAPTSTVDAIINGDYTENTDISCKDLTINSGKTLTIHSGNSLTVAGNLVNNGTIVFKSENSGTARFGQFSGTISGSGNVTVERYLPAKRAWRLLTAPLKGSTGNTVAVNWQGTANEGLLLFSPATYQSTAMTGYTTGGGSPNIWNYDNGWQKITNISTETMFNTNNSDTKAYLVFATGPHGSNTIANTTTALETTLKPVGQLITGSVAHSLTANQFKLLPNPYASPLNTAALVTSNSGTTIWMVDPTLNTFGGYFTFNGTEWTPTTPSASDAYIQSGQGFFVKNAANTTFTIAESHKVSGNSNTWFERTTTDTSVDKIRVLLYKQDNSAWYLADGILAVNSASGNHEVDAADADKMTNFNENLLFKNGTSNLAIEYRGLPAAGTLQPMQLTGTSAQGYELRIKTENYSNSNLTPYLENTQTGVLTAIPTDGSEVIVPFTGIAATSVAPDSRFRIVYQAPLSADDLNNLVVGVYPNPVHESLFTIELTNTNAPARYSLTNLLGQVVQEGSLVSLTNAIPVHDLSEGMYLLQINQEGKRFTTKLMIK